MDPDLLKELGFNPEKFRHAFINNYELRIGNRASIERKKGEVVYGTVMELESSELDYLYGSEGLSDYRPHKLLVTLAGGDMIEVDSYLLPSSKLTGRNSEYAAKLVLIAQKLKLPENYIQKLKSWI